MRSIRTFASLVVLATLPAAALQPSEPHAAGPHRFADAARWAAVFDAPERDEWQRPGIVVGLLGIEEGARVVDLGAGTGYFTRFLSVEVGRTGKVYAVDIENSLLEHIRGRRDVHQSQVETVLADPDDPGLPDGEIDVILTVNTWHHIEDRPAYLRHLARALHGDGRLAIVDWHEGELPHGPPAGTKLSRDAAVAELQQAGWRLAVESVALPYQYFLIWTPPGEARVSSPR